MNVNFKFGWGWKPSDEQFELLNKIIVDGLERTDEGGVCGYTTHTANIRQLMAITNQFELEQTSPSALLQLAAQIESLMARTSAYSQENQFNEKCNVHISNVGLLSINKVKVEMDYCTDNLQYDLDKGWRILAICPQPDSRRPDYILGKS